MGEIADWEARPLPPGGPSSSILAGRERETPERHAVTPSLAGDAVQLIREEVLDNLEGLGTGNLRQAYDAVLESGGRFYLSGGSSHARGVTQQDLAGKPAGFACPPQLVLLALEPWPRQQQGAARNICESPQEGSLSEARSRA